MASAAVAGDTVYVTSNDASRDADLVALATDTGEERWRVPVDAHVTGPVTWANDVVYVSDDSGRIAAYDAADGTRLWSHDVPFPAAGGITVVDGTVYAGWGWWLAGAPRDADGGLIAFRLPGARRAARAVWPPARARASAGGGGDDLGRTVYQQSCASCHGGAGEGASGPAMAGVADRLTVDQHVAVVRDGRGSMPGWDATLSDEEIEAVVEYERTVLDGG